MSPAAPLDFAFGAADYTSFVGREVTCRRIAFAFGAADDNWLD
jgi:hypothetical protein